MNSTENFARSREAEKTGYNDSQILLAKETN